METMNHEWGQANREQIYIKETHLSNPEKLIESIMVLCCSVDRSKWSLENLSTDCRTRSNTSLFKVSSDGQSFHLKLIPFPDPESLYLSKVLVRYPSLRNDTSLTIPRIFDIIDGSGQCLFYAHVTPWIAHSAGTLTENIVSLWFNKRFDDLKNLMASFGAFLAGFHDTYPGLNHNDMNPSNVILKFEADKIRFILVDCAGLDDEVGDDCNTFIESLKVLAEGGFGNEFLDMALTAFTSANHR
jgi:hypothetical protein